MADKEVPKPVIAAATGTAAPSGGPSGAMIEQAMAEAGLKAMEEGVTDPNEIRDRKLAARQKLRDDTRVAADADAKAKKS